LTANFQILELNDNKGELAESMMRALPDWFGIEEAIINYRHDVQRWPTYFACNRQEKPIGFVCLNFHNSYTCEVHVMGVLPDFHRAGAGAALIKYAQDVAQEAGCEYLEVKTLGPSHPDRKFYAATREFYLKMGFCPLEELDGIWEGNPCLIMVKKI
jgi:GNAT superfamily N-acetyltransferase